MPRARRRSSSSSATPQRNDRRTKANPKSAANLAHRAIEQQWVARVNAVASLIGDNADLRQRLKAIDGYGTPMPTRWARNVRRDFVADDGCSTTCTVPALNTAPQRERGDIDLDLDVVGTTTVFDIDQPTKTTRCKQCGPEGRVAVFQRQTRGGDEGMTTFYVCTRCHRQWREN